MATSSTTTAWTAILLTLVASLAHTTASPQSTDLPSSITSPPATAIPSSIVSAAYTSATSDPNSPSGVPDCARSCLAAATLSLSCQSMDTQCLCAHAQEIHDRSTTCLAASTCSQADIDTAADYYDTLCVQLGYPLGAPASSTGTATDTTPMPSAQSASPTPAASTSPTSLPTQDAAAASASLKISIIVGAAVGAALLLALGLLTFFILYTRRPRRERDAAEAEKAAFRFRHPPAPSLPPTSDPVRLPHPTSSAYSMSSYTYPHSPISTTTHTNFNTFFERDHKSSQLSTSSTAMNSPRINLWKSQAPPLSHALSRPSSTSTILTMVTVSDIPESRPPSGAQRRPADFPPGEHAPREARMPGRVSPSLASFDFGLDDGRESSPHDQRNLSTRINGPASFHQRRIVDIPPRKRPRDREGEPGPWRMDVVGKTHNVV